MGMLKDDSGIPAENHAIISIGRKLWRTVVELQGTMLHSTCMHELIRGYEN